MDTRLDLGNFALDTKISGATEIMRDFLFEGQVLSGVVTSEPYVRGDRLSGPSENNCIWTGYYLMTLCHQFLATKDDSIKEKALRTCDASLKLQQVTRTDHLVARSYRTQESKTLLNDQLDAFFARGRRNFTYRVVNDSHSILTATSKGQMEGWLHGLCEYFDSGMAEPTQIHEIQRIVGNVIKSYILNGYEIIDLDGKPTDQGSHKNSDNPLRAGLIDMGTYVRKLAILKLAHHITNDQFFEDEYQRVYSSFLLHTSGKGIFTRMHPGEALRRLISTKQNYPSYHLEALAIEALARYEPGNSTFKSMLEHMGLWSEKKGLVPFTQGSPSQETIRQLLGMQVNKVLTVISSKPSRQSGNLRDTSQQGEEFSWRCATNRQLVYPNQGKNSMTGSMEFSPLDILYAYWKLRSQIK